MKDNEQKKIMFFLPSLAMGGAERTVVNLANAMADKGLIVDLVVSDLIGEKKTLLLDEVNPNVNLIHLGVSRVFKSIFKLKDRFEEKKYDVVYSSITHSNIVCCIAKILSKQKFKLIVREVSTASMAAKQLSYLMAFILKVIVPFLYKKTHRVVCVSKGAIEDFKQHYKYKYNNVSFVYNPVLNDDYREKLKHSVDHHFFKENNKVILAVGRLEKVKNFTLLIQSFAVFYKKNPSARLLLLGDGTLRKDLDHLVEELGIKDVVAMPGFVVNPYAYFKYCDLFVFSSNYEGLGGTIIQALPTKIKIISTDCPNGPSEILDNGKYGLLLPVNDKNEMIEAMEKVFSNQYPDINEKELEEHCLQFTPEQVVEKYIILQD